ncbi:MAG: bifunctional demethylmenaquinone methyltransferase/2-methoxy-6-polyprenyl-1,4-benzoquinol methylase UbiE [Actinobacteria bacterium]|nr:bifunctional demethylmenaquinone methyltransferase/2-methoxy-6-polyprenyl-1,4-benzoquinol methylase UbiE [Actinomycetota bacterium]
MKKVKTGENSNTISNVKVEKLFNRISGRYDLTNTLISLGLEKYWRLRFIKNIEGSEQRILDAACGTGISSYGAWIKTKKKSHVYGVDFSEDMLDIAKKRYNKIIGNKGNLTFMEGDITDLEFRNNFFDLITIVFGIRPASERKEALKEFYRVAKPGGRLIIMEFSYPKSSFFRKIYDFYMDKIIINSGALITRDRNAYKFLVRTIRAFPEPEDFADIIMECGWAQAKYLPMTFGTCTIYTALKVK